MIDLLENKSLIQNDEEMLSAFLKNKYLEKTNRMAQPVFPNSGIYVKYIKRILDLGISVPAFAVCLPFNIVFGICTFFDVGMPIFYRQTRMGKDGKPFELVKFRNMNNNTDKDGILLPAKERVTRFGKIMRKFSLDELLNFWFVIKGDMSIIGPRPLPVFFYDRMSDRHKMRTAVKPGLECPRVIYGDPDQCQYQNQFENDIWYVEHVSFLTDLRMMLLLFIMPFNLRKRSKAAMGNGYFAGYDQNGIATTLNRFKRMYPEDWRKIEEESRGLE